MAPRSHVAALVLTVMLATVVSACSGSAGSVVTTRPEPVAQLHVYVDLPLAGGAGDEARAMLQAIRIEVERREGRAGPFAVEVIPSDDSGPAGGSSVARCRNGARAAVRDPLAVAVIGTYDSACSQVVLATLAGSGIVLVSPVNADPAVAVAGDAAQGGPMAAGALNEIVRLAPSWGDEGVAAADLARQLGVHRLYVLSAGGQRGADTAAALVAAAPAYGIQLAGSEPLRLAGTPAGQGALRRARADGVYVSGGELPAVATALRGIARRPTKRAPKVIVAGTLYASALPRLAGAAANGVHVVFGAVPASSLTGAGADFADAYRQRYGEPGVYTAAAAEAADVVLDAIARSGGGRASVAAAALAPLPHTGLLGRWWLDRERKRTPVTLAAFTIADAGAFRLDRLLTVP